MRKDVFLKAVRKSIVTSSSVQATNRRIHRNRHHRNEPCVSHEHETEAHWMLLDTDDATNDNDNDAN